MTCAASAYECFWLLNPVQQIYSIKTSFEIVSDLQTFSSVLTTIHLGSKIKYSVRDHPFMTSTRGGGGSGGRIWTGVGSSPCGRPHRKLKLESTDVILSCKEAGVFFTRISSLDGKKWKFFCDIN